MNPFRIYLVVLSLFFFSASLDAQIRIHDKNKGRKPAKKKNLKRAGEKEEPPYWIYGFGWNVVDDNSKPFKKLFDFRKSWNIRPYPTQLTIEKSHKYGLSYCGMFNFNIYKPGKIINGKDNTGSFLFFSIDALAKYHFKEHFRLQEWCDIYFPLGAGYTLRFAPPYRSTAMFDIGLGANFWIKKWVGINVQSLAKFGLRSPIIRTGSNYLQHSVGLVFKISKQDKKKFPSIKARYKWIHRKPLGHERN